MLSCPGNIPDYWNSYEVLEKSNYGRLLVHLTDGVKMELTLKLIEETTWQLPSSASPAVIDYPLSNGLDLGDENSELNPLHDSFHVEYKWQSEKRGRAVETTTYFDLFDPKNRPPVFLPAQLPGKPEKHTVFLSPIPVVNPFDAKYCVVVTLFYFIVFFTFCVLLSIIAKYYVEREFFKTR